jgi:predicted dinucleotide-binding enzyme
VDQRAADAGASDEEIATSIGVGVPAVLSNSRGPDSLADLVTDIGGPVRAGARDEAAAQNLVLVAVNWSKLPIAVAGLPDFGGRRPSQLP